jgi:excinuclease ABC subunit C
MDAVEVRGVADDLPDEPGVYQFTDGDRTLYVGKAVDLRSRVRSYADPRSVRIQRMLGDADAVDVTVTDTETQALLLEANLIKRHRPPYNVRLTDDKSYPLIQLTDHDAPRIQITRDPEPDATVFGPFTDRGRLDAVCKALRETFGLRGCSDHKYANRDRPCLDYDVGLCSAPCTGEIDPGEYRADVERVERFLRGETGVLAEPLREAMAAASEAERFERAANLRDRLSAVEAFHDGGAAAVHTADTDAGFDDERVDVIGAAIRGDRATVARLRAEGGQLVGRERHRVETPTAEAADGDRAGSEVVGTAVADVLGAFLAQFYAERELPDAVLLPERPAGADVPEWLDREGVAVRVPGAGREATLVDLALKNARRTVGQRDASRALAERLGLETPPARIEAFDVSHASGRATVGSDVLVVDGDPDRSGYRRKRLPDTDDDYESMRALLRWRAERAVEGRDDRPDPDLLLIDGGEGQLRAAREAVQAVGWDVPLIALAKAEERVVTTAGSAQWPEDDPGLQVLQRARDEAHRFAVAYHQTVRDQVATALDGIEGVGPERRKRLLRRFGSVQGIRDASPAELAAVDGIGEATAQRLAARL